MKQNRIYYSIFAAIILIILSTFVNKFCMKIFVSFFLMTIILYWITNNIYQSLMISFLISLVFYISHNNYVCEGFDTEDIKIDDIVKELTQLSNDTVKDKKDEINEDDLTLFEDADKDKTPTITDNKYMESAKAQRETFRLINTIKQLDDTVKNLAPTLQQGANIIAKFKKLNLIS